VNLARVRDVLQGMAIGRAATTDEAFVRTLYVEHGGALLAYATRLTGERASAEDVVQETLLRAWRRAGELADDRRPVRPWLFAVARNLIIDRRRQGRRRDEAPETELDDLSAVDELDRALDAWQVADAMAELSPEHREVLIETYYRGRSVAEAAEAIGVPAGTVKSRTYYALRSMRLRLEERGWGG
jgi:RNA polymerase sigma-70 factor (ECF subfamily)